jgi:hypothetical protein
VVEAGFHEEAIRLVAKGEVDASAVDSQVLAVALRDDPSLGDAVRVIDALGPSTIQPVAVSIGSPRIFGRRSVGPSWPWRTMRPAGPGSRTG